jgi:hypothetical protein
MQLHADIEAHEILLGVGPMYSIIVFLQWKATK